MKVFEYTHDKPYADSKYTGLFFVLSYPDPKNPTKLMSGPGMEKCREFFTMRMQAAIRSKNDAATEKAYALVTSGTSPVNGKSSTIWLDKVKVSIAMLNAFEKHYGIPLTKIYPVVNPRWKEKAFIVGSKRWTRSRYSFGLWTLFFRLGFDVKFTTASFRHLLPKMKWPELYDRIANCFDNQAKTVFPHVETFFAFEKKYLKDRFDNWDPEHVTYLTCRPEGILKLVTGNSNSPYFKELWENFKYEKR